MRGISACGVAELKFWSLVLMLYTIQPMPIDPVPVVPCSISFWALKQRSLLEPRCHRIRMTYWRPAFLEMQWRISSTCRAVFMNGHHQGRWIHLALVASGNSSPQGEECFADIVVGIINKERCRRLLFRVRIPGESSWNMSL